MFFKKKENKIENSYLVKVCALLIHAAKIDENFTVHEEEIIKKTLLELGTSQEDLSKTLKKAKIIEENSNQILDFTREVNIVVPSTRRTFNLYHTASHVAGRVPFVVVC